MVLVVFKEVLAVLKSPFFIIAILLANSSYALSSFDYRKESSFGVDVMYAPVSIPFPNVIGGGLAYNFNSNWQLRLDYMTTDNAVDYSDLKVASVNEENYGI